MGWLVQSGLLAAELSGVGVWKSVADNCLGLFVEAFEPGDVVNISLRIQRLKNS